METNKEQQHTKGPWKMQNNSDIYSGDICIGSLAFMYGFGFNIADGKRIVSCVNALEGIEDPEGFVLLAKQMAEFNEMFKVSESVTDLLKYKTACEGINKDNPMAVAESLRDILLFLKCIDDTHGEDVPIWVYRMATELLTKLQSK